MRDIAEIFKALSDTTRLKILRIVATRNSRPNVAEIASKIGVSVSAISQHMKVLRHAGIVEYDKRGNQVFYYVNEAAIGSFGEEVKDLIRMVFIPCGRDGACEDCGREGGCKA